MLRRKCDLAAGSRDVASLSLRSNFIISRVVRKYYLYVPIIFYIPTQRSLSIKEEFEVDQIVVIKKLNSVFCFQRRIMELIISTS